MTSVSSMFNFDASAADTVPVSQSQFILPRQVPTSARDTLLKAQVPHTQTGFVGVVAPFKSKEDAGKLIAELGERTKMRAKFSSTEPNYVHVHAVKDKSGVAMVNHLASASPFSGMDVPTLKKQSAAFQSLQLTNYTTAVGKTGITAAHQQLLPYASQTWTASTMALKEGVPKFRTFYGKPLILVDMNTDNVSGFVYAIWAFATFEGMISTKVDSAYRADSIGAQQQGGFIQTLLDVGSQLLPLFGLLVKSTVFITVDGNISLREEGDHVSTQESDVVSRMTSMIRQTELGLQISKQIARGPKKATPAKRLQKRAFKPKGKKQRKG